MWKRIVCALCLSMTWAALGDDARMEEIVDAQNWTRDAPGPWPLFVGNGRLGFSVDPSGAQLFKGRYPHATLSLLAQDIWFHPDPPGDRIDRDLTLVQYSFRDRTIGYATKPQESESALYNQLREYPTKPCLGTPRLGLTVNGAELRMPEQLTQSRQILELYSAVVKTEYQFEKVSAQVATYLHAARNILSFTVEDRGEGTLLRTFTFELRSPAPTSSGERNPAEDDKLTFPFATETVQSANSRIAVFRPLPRDFGYAVGVCAVGADVAWTVTDGHIQGQWSSGRGPVTVYLAILPGRGRPKVMSEMDDLLSDIGGTPPNVVSKEHAAWWKDFWGRSFVDFTGSTDPRAPELQRRWVRDLYLVATNARGANPPAESGLIANSWYGKFHLEMTFWHIAGLLSSNRADLLRDMLLWYTQALEPAQRRAKAHGFEGARFAKMTSYHGEDSPSSVAQLILWHVGEIPLLCDRYYRATRDEDFRRQVYPVIAETADFCCSYATFDPADGRYHLLPPIASCAENTDPKTTKDPAYELASFAAALRIAIATAAEMGRDAEKVPRWREVLSRLAEPPYDGSVYLTCAGLTDSYEAKYTGSGSHPGMMGLLFNCGYVPADDRMSRTLDKVLATWNFDQIWGWDFGLCAANAAHLGRGEDAVNLLTSGAFANRRLPSGWNSRWPETRPVSDAMPYLPGSGGTVLALHEMLAHDAGGNLRVFPGIPHTPGWTVSFTNIVTANGTRVSGKMEKGQTTSAEAYSPDGTPVAVPR